MKLKDIINYEEMLLTIEHNHKEGSITLPFDVLISLETELDKIGKITDIFFREIERFAKIDENVVEKERERMLNTEIDCVFEFKL